MANDFVQLWVSYEAYFEPLGDNEVGRLCRAMVKYKSTGIEPKLNGNERFVWPAIKRDIDLSNAAYEKLSQTRKNARLGISANDNNSLQMITNDIKCNQNTTFVDKDKVKDKVKDKDIMCVGDKSPDTDTPKPKKFIPPTVEQVQAYCEERNNSVNAERFVDFYESKGWFVGKNRMKDWKAAVRNWEKDDNKSIKPQETRQNDPWRRFAQQMNDV